MSTRTAIVLFQDQRAGLLQETERGGTRFIYDPGWREPIACCFPSDRREHDWRVGLHPFFEHLGTEGWLRQQQARAAHLVEEDDIGLLLRFGADCIGAVSIARPDEDQPLPPINEQVAAPGRTVSGVQRKLLAVRANVPGRELYEPAGAAGPAPFIAKFDSETVPTLVRNERLSLQWLAKALGAKEVTGFTTAAVKLASGGGEREEYALVVKRFDRSDQGAKLRLEDFAQILCKPRGRDYAGKYDAAYEDVAHVIQTHSVRPIIDLGRFFRRLVLFAIVGNCDAHLKNFSLLETPVGLRLSPAYDVLNTALYPGYDRQLALSIDGQKRQLDIVNHALLRSFGLSIGLSARAVDQAFEDLARRVRNAAAVIAPPQGEPPDGFVHRFSEIVEGACLRILPR